MKPFTVFLFFLLSLPLSAQYQKGNGYFDGTTGMAFENSVGEAFFDYTTLSAYSYQVGAFFTDRLLVGSRMNFLYSVPQAPNNRTMRLQLKPYARYYFPGGDQRKVSFFGEAGFGTIGFFNSSGFETDFHFGGGAEISLAPGVLGTGNLTYNANASGLNFTNLRLGLNVLTGQIENAGSAVSLSQGTWVADAYFGGINYGRMSRNGITEYQLSIDISPKIGFFVSDRFLVEGSFDIVSFSSRDFFGFEERSIKLTQLGLGTDLSYYLKQNGRTFPYVTAGASFKHSKQNISAIAPGGIESFSELNWRVGAGFAYFFSPNLSFNGEARYQRDQIRIDDFRIATIQPQKSILLEAGFQFYLIRNTK